MKNQGMVCTAIILIDFCRMFFLLFDNALY